jgi:hypothetical protein
MRRGGQPLRATIRSAFRLRRHGPALRPRCNAGGTCFVSVVNVWIEVLGRCHRHLHDRQAEVHTHTAAEVLTACEQDGARRADLCPSLP